MALAAVAALAGPVEQAYACSCAVLDVPRELQVVDAAFVGRVLSRRVERPTAPIFSSADPAFWTFAVERAVKGTLPSRIVVTSAAEGASCGLELQQGERIGLLVDADDGQYSSSLCRQVDPDLLAGFASPAAGDDVWWRFAAITGALIAALAGFLSLRRRAARAPE